MIYTQLQELCFSMYFLSFILSLESFPFLLKVALLQVYKITNDLHKLIGHKVTQLNHY